MPPTITDQPTYWDHYAEGLADHPLDEALKNAFGWTQYPGHGPGDELLGDATTALELGSGRGDAVAALATKGLNATGLDISPIQCQKARARWAHLPKAHFEHGDVLCYLAATNRCWDAIYSNWGAAWFTNSKDLFPLIHDHLTPGGKLVFSHAPPVLGAYGVQGTYAAGLTGRQVWLYRWSYEPATWATILETHGWSDPLTQEAQKLLAIMLRLDDLGENLMPENVDPAVSARMSRTRGRGAFLSGMAQVPSAAREAGLSRWT